MSGGFSPGGRRVILPLLLLSTKIYNSNYFSFLKDACDTFKIALEG